MSIRYIKISYILSICLLLFFVGCANFEKIFAPQQLSENYALMPGVECDAPEVVDGDLNTVSNNTR
ncbi:MAG: hypothetical protein ACPL7B_15780, partial [Candidatus Poribacteria bacterium]